RRGGRRVGRVGSGRTLEGVCLRHAGPGDLGAGRSAAGAAARRELHQQLEDARAARRRGGDEVVDPVDRVASRLPAGVGAGGVNGAARRTRPADAGATIGVFGALRDGIRRVNRAPAVLLGVFAMTLLVSVPLAVAMRSLLAQHLGNSLIADSAAS